MPGLVNAVQLDKLRKDLKNVILLEASWHLPDANDLIARDSYQDFLNEHIVGARYFDFALFHDADSVLPNQVYNFTAANLEKMAVALRQLGIHEYSKVIFYDRSDLRTSCRALWIMKLLGHNPANLYLLDGGYEAWKRYGGKVESGSSRPVVLSDYKVHLALQYIRDLSAMKQNLSNSQEQLVDVRHPVRFAGGLDHRAHVRGGHIPGSFCFPYFIMFEEDGTFKPRDYLQKRLAGIGVELHVPIVTTCGSGMSAAILNFVLDLLDVPSHALYDGAWAEWGFDGIYAGEISLDERPVARSIDNP